MWGFKSPSPSLPPPSQREGGGLGNKRRGRIGRKKEEGGDWEREKRGIRLRKRFKKIFFFKKKRDVKKKRKEEKNKSVSCFKKFIFLKFFYKKLFNILNWY